MKIKKKLIILGASGHGKVVAEIAQKMAIWEKIGFIDDDTSLNDWLTFNFYGDTDCRHLYKENSDFFIGIGNNLIREALQNQFEKEGFSIATLVHPDSIVGLDVTIGKGSVIMAGAIINASTRIGNGCIINTGSTVDHDCCIDDFCHISPGANIAGNVRIGQRTWLGVGSAVINNITVYGDCIIGAGGAVVNNLQKPGTYVGVPVRRLER